MDSLFVQGSWEILHHREWRAYPVLTPREVMFEMPRICQSFVDMSNQKTAAVTPPSFETSISMFGCVSIVLKFRVFFSIFRFFARSNRLPPVKNLVT